VSALRLAHPEWLISLLLALALVVAAVALASLVARRRRLRLLGSAGRIAHGTFRSDAALLLALAAIVVALLGPRIGERVERVPATGVDVVLSLDVSRSMDARDVPPSRIARARRAARELLARLEPADRVGLAAYAGAGVLLAPLTPDRGVIAELLAGIDTGLVTPGSSDVRAGIRAALPAFEAGSTRPRIVFLLGDGEDPERRRDLGAAEAARAGVRVVVAAFGTERGATVPDHGVPLVDRSGRTVVSRRQLERLGSLATDTDGALLASDEWGDIDLAAATRAIRRDAGGAAAAWVERRVPAVRVLPFAALAFAILLLEGLPRPRAVGRHRFGSLLRRAGAPVVAGGVLMAAPASLAGDGVATLTALEAEVRARPGDPAALVALGAARLERGQRRAASRAFLAAAIGARTPREAAVAYHDLGVAALEEGDLEAARAAFLDALAFVPGDPKARFNLEWTLLALRQQAPPPPPAEEREPPPAPPREASPPDQAPEAERAAAEAPAARTPLGESERRRRLERIEDDPARALQSAAAARRARPAGGGPVW